MLSKSIPILLAKGENLISSYMGIDLTNFRLYKTTKRGTIENLYLKNLDSCEFQLLSNPFYLILGVLFLLSSIVIYIKDTDNNGMIAGTISVMGLVAILLFFLLRRQALRFRAGSSIISVAVSGNDSKLAQEFINNVVAAKSSTI
jgi:uncharacterized membrane-anchored protein